MCQRKSSSTVFPGTIKIYVSMKVLDMVRGFPCRTLVVLTCDDHLFHQLCLMIFATADVGFANAFQGEKNIRMVHALKLLLNL